MVIRVEKTKNYVTMSNYHLREKAMSLKAKGLLSLMLSLPENWDYSIAGLVAICKENETAIKNTLDELKKLGYLVVNKKMPNETKTGRIEYEYIVYEQKQGVGFLGVEFLGLENQGQINIDNKLLKKESIVNNKNHYIINGEAEEKTIEDLKNKYGYNQVYDNLQPATLQILGVIARAEQSYSEYEEKNILYAENVYDTRKFLDYLQNIKLEDILKIATTITYRETIKNKNAYVLGALLMGSAKNETKVEDWQKEFAELREKLEKVYGR